MIPRRRRRAVVLALTLAFWLAVAGSADVRFERGLLFEVREASHPPCYVFGTIHSEDPRVLDLSAATRSAFDRSEMFVMEAIPDAQAIIRSMIAMVYRDGRTLESVIGSDLYEQSLGALSARGMSENAVRDFKPWAVATILSVPPADTGAFLDIRLYETAVSSGKEIIGLESIEEQLAVFDDFSETDQVSLLRETLEVRDMLPRFFESLLLAYLDRDLAGLLRLSDEYLRGGDPKLAARFADAALGLRNVRMARRLEPYLRRGGCFVAVGALHLPGADGILERLHRQGYLVRMLD